MACKTTSCNGVKKSLPFLYGKHNLESILPPMPTSNSRICFVISPIGADGSETRRHANDVFDLLVEPALKPFQFNVIRADKIAGSGQINQEIIELVQGAELCIIDLTEQNPNVFYECGRRHESGKPFIQIIRQGDKIPFDLAGIRTIHYDLSTPRSTLDSVDQVQEFVSTFEAADFQTKASGVSIASLAEALDRIERKLTSASGFMPTGPVGPVSGLHAFQGIRQAFQDALMRGDISAAISLLPRVKEKLGATSLAYLAGAKALATAGEEIGLSILLEIVTEQRNTLDEVKLQACLNGISQYFVSINREQEGLQRTGTLFSEFGHDAKFSKEFRAHCLNQLQILQHGVGNHSEALELAREVIALCPDEPSYYFNMSIDYEKLGMIDKAIQTVETCLTLGAKKNEHDADHLAHAYDLYKKTGDEPKLQAVMQHLQAIDPVRAAFKRTRG